MEFLFSGLQLCFGQAVDPELLNLIKIEVAELRDSVKLWKDDVDNTQVCYVHIHVGEGEKHVSYCLHAVSLACCC